MPPLDLTKAFDSARRVETKYKLSVCSVMDRAA